MLVLVAAGEVLGMSLWFSATAAAPAIAQEFALNAATRAWLTMAVQAGFVAGTLLTAVTNAADAINPRRLFALGCFFGAVTNAAIALAPGGAVMVTLRFLTGAALAWVYPPGMKIIAGWFRERRGSALGVVVGAVVLGSALPHLLNWVGAGLPWRLLVTSSSVLAIGGGALVGLGVSDGPFVSASAPFDRHALRVVLQSRGTRLAVIGYLGHMWELYAMWTWIAAFATASLASIGLAPRAAGSALAFVAIATGSVGCVVAGRWADEWGKARIAQWSMIVSASCAALSPLFFGVPLSGLVLLAVVWGFSAVSDSAQFSALVTDYAPRTHVGTALTIQTSAGFLLTMVSVRLVPPIMAAIGWRWAFVFLIPGPLIGIWAMRGLKTSGSRTLNEPAFTA